jgi:ribose 5-phosphate isomerase A
MDLKRIAGERAADYVENGMRIGLGSGSTVYWTIRRLGALVRGGLEIAAVPTSERTAALMREDGIPFAEGTAALDLAIDGADEIDPALALVKGAGGALLREKLVAVMARRLIVVADESKLVGALGARPLPVEIVPYLWETTAARVEKLGGRPVLRRADSKTFVTDNGNYILDCAFGALDDPAALDRRLKLATGVVETGLFVGLAAAAIVAGAGGVEIIEREEKK